MYSFFKSQPINDVNENFILPFFRAHSIRRNSFTFIVLNPLLDVCRCFLFVYLYCKNNMNRRQMKILWRSINVENWIEKVLSGRCDCVCSWNCTFKYLNNVSLLHQNMIDRFSLLFIFFFFVNLPKPHFQIVDKPKRKIGFFLFANNSMLHVLLIVRRWYTFARNAFEVIVWLICKL